MKSILLCIVALIEFGAAAQTRTHGKILADSAGRSNGIPGVRVKIPAWNVETMTDSTGTFYFQMVASDAVKIIAYFGNNDSSEFTFDPSKQAVPVLVRPLSSLPPITVNAVRSTWKIAAKGIRKTEILGEGEFKKAACCTLGESFETTNAVEVSNSDGVSGIRHVEMLGLAGKYMNITRNNLPFLRGFAQLNGLNQIPGPMVSGVSIAKGAGSVSGGFEGLTGSIDYGLKAEPNDPVLFLNAFGNSQRRYEGNLVSTQKINRQFQNHTYLHYGQQQHVTDKGGDGLSDMPEFQRYFVSDQLSYHFKMAEGMTGFSHTNELRKGGALEALHHPLHAAHEFLFSQQESKTELWSKLGLFLDPEKEKSIGNIVYFTDNRMSSTLNNLRQRKWNGHQQSAGYTGTYASPEEQTWSVRAGIQLQYDLVQETFADSGGIFYNPSRKEFSAGVFNELVFQTEKLMLVGGLRADHNNLYGNYITPRFHLRYSPDKSTRFHLQTGTGRRSSWLFAENLPYLIGNRTLVFESDIYNQAYGMKQEYAWNSGASVVREGFVFHRSSTFSADLFYTSFMNQVVADRDADPTKIIFKNERGNQTWASQVEWALQPMRRMDLKLSYRYIRNLMFLGGKQQMQPLLSPHRVLLVWNYVTRKKTGFDIIGQWNSSKRLPSSSAIPESLKRSNQTPAYAILNLQIRQTLKHLELYLGAENALNVIQKNPVMNASDPHSAYFDAAWAWGPTMGRNVYAGMRWTLK